MRWPWQRKPAEPKKDDKPTADTIDVASVKAQTDSLVREIRANLAEVAEAADSVQRKLRSQS